MTIEPDLSNALPFAAAALVTGGRVEVAGFPVGSTLQPVDEVLELLTALGARLEVDAERGSLVVDGSGGLRAPGEVDMSAVGELVPVVAALAALADPVVRPCAASPTCEGTRPTGSPRWPPS